MRSWLSGRAPALHKLMVVGSNPTERASRTGLYARRSDHSCGTEDSGARGTRRIDRSRRQRRRRRACSARRRPESCRGAARAERRRSRTGRPRTGGGCCCSGGRAGTHQQVNRSAKEHYAPGDEQAHLGAREHGVSVTVATTTCHGSPLLESGLVWRNGNSCNRSRRGDWSNGRGDRRRRLSKPEVRDCSADDQERSQNERGLESAHAGISNADGAAVREQVGAPASSGVSTAPGHEDEPTPRERVVRRRLHAVEPESVLGGSSSPGDNGVWSPPRNLEAVIMNTYHGHFGSSRTYISHRHRSCSSGGACASVSREARDQIPVDQARVRC
jgi:hypothetical protein